MLESIGQAAKKAVQKISCTSTRERNNLLFTIGKKLSEYSDTILLANEQDMSRAKAHGLSDAMLDRLLLTPSRLEQIINDVYHVAKLPDPVGQIIDGSTLENGLAIKRLRVPLGVIGVIYEARPNVTVDIASLCLKTGNAAILRGGSETALSNKALVEAIGNALVECNFPEHSVQLIEKPERELVTALLKLDRYVDMIIPRGGLALQRLCQEQATVPVILGGVGVCHIFVDASADIALALPVLENAKVQRPSVCNAMETLLVDKKIAEDLLPQVTKRLGALGVVFHACENSFPLIAKAGGSVFAVKEEDYSKEWLSLDINVRIVDGVAQAAEHIRMHGTKHSEAILTQTFAHADLFIASVDAAAIYINASTRFTDGGEFGLGAEVAVSTQKLHARGPMGLEALTTHKWIGYGDGLIRS